VAGQAYVIEVNIVIKASSNESELTGKRKRMQFNTKYLKKYAYFCQLQDMLQSATERMRRRIWVSI
jgi:hypothetical protein